MNEVEAVRRFVDAIHSTQIPHMLVGSLSSNYYARPMSTRDADFVVQGTGDFIQRLAEHLGEGFNVDPQMSFETITGTYRYVIRMAGSPFKFELFLLSDDDHDQTRFKRRRNAKYEGCEVFVPSPEDVVITKLRWSSRGKRTKDTDDVRNLIAVQGDRIDWDYVYPWCEKHGTTKLLDEIRASIPPI